MEQHNLEIGTRRDLVLYRLETARTDLKSARALFFLLKIIKEPITEHIIPFFMQLMQYMLSTVKHIKDIRML